jgi:hypothetical protein
MWHTSVLQYLLVFEDKHVLNIANGDYRRNCFVGAWRLFYERTRGHVVLDNDDIR